MAVHEPRWSAEEAREPRASTRSTAAAVAAVCIASLAFLAAVSGGAWWLLHRDSPRESAADESPRRETASTGSAPATPLFELDKSKQKSIWDSEHITFEIEAYVCPSFVEALRARDADSLAGLFLESAECAVPQLFDARSRSHGGVSEASLTVLDSSTQHASPAVLADWLIEQVASFTTFERGRLRILEIQPAEDDSTRWEMRMLLAVHGRAADGGPIMLSSEHLVAARFESDEDIQAGRILTDWTVQEQTIRRGERPLFEEVTEKSGLADLPLYDNWKSVGRQFLANHAAVDDFNGDGFPDIAVGQFSGSPALLRNVDGGGFEEVSALMGIRKWSSAQDRLTCLVAWADVDDDGYPDLIAGNRLYKNRQGKSFVDVTASSGLRFGLEPMGVNVIDYDCDGLLDLYVIYQRAPGQLEGGRSEEGDPPWVGDDESGAENQLWKNLGNGFFEDVTAVANAGGGRRRSFAASWFFHDEDRFPDVYIANDFGENILLRNRGDGTFEDVSAASGAIDYATSMGVASGDLNNDGTAEIYVANMYSKMGRRIIGQVCDDDYPQGVFTQIQGSCAGNRLYTRAPGGNYHDVGEIAGVNGVGWAYGPAVVDLDADGLLDLYATTGFLSFDRGKPDG